MAFLRKDLPGKKDGLYPIVFIINHKNDKYKVQTNLKTKGWDQQAQSVPGKFSNAQQVNKALKKQSLVLQDIIDHQSEFDIVEIRKLFKSYLKAPDEFDISKQRVADTEQGVDFKLLTRKWTVDIWEKYDSLTDVGKKFWLLVEHINYDHSSDWSDGYRKRMRTVRTKILNFDPEFKPESFTEKWFRRYCKHCVEDLGNVSNTINTDTKAFHALIKELRKDGYDIPVDLDKIEWKYTEPEEEGLDWCHVQHLALMSLVDHPEETTKGSLEASRILWVVSALTGRRWEEVATMSKSNFYQVKGKWRYKNVAKGNVITDIPLLPEAVDFIVNKIKFKFPKLSNQNVNANIKIVCRIAGLDEERLRITVIDKNHTKQEMVPLYKSIHFHTARHSYGHHIAELAAGKPFAQKFIAFMLGHASYQTSWKYMNRGKGSNEQMFDDVILDAS